MAEFKWTQPQEQAITTTGHSLLVSAGAGSGKTAVLAERCVHLVMDAQPASNIDQLLVVTFTDAAAAEMRARIGEALRKRFIGSSGHARLRHQLLLLDSAHISTIHSFCRHVLNRHFAAADLEPKPPLMDSRESQLLRERTARRLFDDWARREDETGEAFLRLLDAYGGHYEKGLLDQLLDLEAFLESVVDPDQWLRSALAKFESSAPDRLSDDWFSTLRGTLIGELREQLGTIDHQLLELNPLADVALGFIPCLADYRDHLEGWLTRVEKDSSPEALNQVCREEIASYRMPRGPSFTKKIQELDPRIVHDFKKAQDCFKHVREKLFQKKLRDAFGLFSTAEWSEGIARTAPHVRTICRLLETLQKRFRAAKADLGVLDFSDLERMTLNLLRDADNGVSDRLRDAFQHVLVDEFQDVNRLQAELLRLVSREPDPSRADNLFVVGDVKQSIYRFRLAEPRLFIKRQKAFLEVDRQRGDSAPQHLIPLTDNFRSRSNVIDAVNAIFEKLMAPDLGGIAYDKDARLKCGRTNDLPLPGPAIELHVLESLRGGNDHQEEEGDSSDAFDWEGIEREAYVIAERIRALKKSGHDHGDMVILLRAMKTHCHLLVRTLLKQGVPVFAEVSGGLFGALEVMDILSLLNLLDNEQQDIPLAAVLRSPLIGPPLSDSELVEIRTAGDGAQARLPFHAAVRRYAEQGADTKLKSRLGKILTQIRDWRRRMGCRPVAEVLWEIYEESGYLAYVGGLSEGGQRRANLLQLHEYARRFADFQRQGLVRFLRYLDGIR
ncbi:MAG: UvrD-helicase domain-containing protein [Phycisphaerae bacterium]